MNGSSMIHYLKIFDDQIQEIVSRFKNLERYNFQDVIAVPSVLSETLSLQGYGVCDISPQWVLVNAHDGNMLLLNTFGHRKEFFSKAQEIIREEFSQSWWKKVVKKRESPISSEVLGVLKNFRTGDDEDDIVTCIREFSEEMIPAAMECICFLGAVMKYLEKKEPVKAFNTFTHLRDKLISFYGPSGIDCLNTDSLFDDTERFLNSITEMTMLPQMNVLVLEIRRLCNASVREFVEEHAMPLFQKRITPFIPPILLYPWYDNNNNFKILGSWQAALRFLGFIEAMNVQIEDVKNIDRCVLFDPSPELIEYANEYAKRSSIEPFIGTPESAYENIPFFGTDFSTSDFPYASCSCRSGEYRKRIQHFICKSCLLIVPIKSDCPHCGEGCKSDGIEVKFFSNCCFSCDKDKALEVVTACDCIPERFLPQLLDTLLSSGEVRQFPVLVNCIMNKLYLRGSKFCHDCLGDTKIPVLVRSMKEPWRSFLLEASSSKSCVGCALTDVLNGKLKFWDFLPKDDILKPGQYEEFMSLILCERVVRPKCSFHFPLKNSTKKSKKDDDDGKSLSWCRAVAVRYLSQEGSTNGLNGVVQKFHEEGLIKVIDPDVARDLLTTDVDDIGALRKMISNGGLTKSDYDEICVSLIGRKGSKSKISKKKTKITLNKLLFGKPCCEKSRFFNHTTTVEISRMNTNDKELKQILNKTRAKWKQVNVVTDLEASLAMFDETDLDGSTVMNTGGNAKNKKKKKRNKKMNSSNISQLSTTRATKSRSNSISEATLDEPLQMPPKASTFSTSTEKPKLKKPNTFKILFSELTGCEGSLSSYASTETAFASTFGNKLFNTLTSYDKISPKEVYDLMGNKRNETSENGESNSKEVSKLLGRIRMGDEENTESESKTDQLLTESNKPKLSKGQKKRLRQKKLKEEKLNLEQQLEAKRQLLKLKKEALMEKRRLEKERLALEQKQQQLLQEEKHNTKKIQQQKQHQQQLQRQKQKQEQERKRKAVLELKKKQQQQQQQKQKQQKEIAPSSSSDSETDSSDSDDYDFSVFARNISTSKKAAKSNKKVEIAKSISKANQVKEDANQKDINNNGNIISSKSEKVVSVGSQYLPVVVPPPVHVVEEEGKIMNNVVKPDTIKPEVKEPVMKKEEQKKSNDIKKYEENREGDEEEDIVPVDMNAPLYDMPAFPQPSFSRKPPIAPKKAIVPKPPTKPITVKQPIPDESQPPQLKSRIIISSPVPFKKGAKPPPGSVLINSNTQEVSLAKSQSATPSGAQARIISRPRAIGPRKLIKPVKLSPEPSTSTSSVSAWIKPLKETPIQQQQQQNEGISIKKKVSAWSKPKPLSIENPSVADILKEEEDKRSVRSETESINNVTEEIAEEDDFMNVATASSVISTVTTIVEEEDLSNKKDEDENDDDENDTPENPEDMDTLLSQFAAAAAEVFNNDDDTNEGKDEFKEINIQKNHHHHHHQQQQQQQFPIQRSLSLNDNRNMDQFSEAHKKHGEDSFESLVSMFGSSNISSESATSQSPLSPASHVSETPWSSTNSMGNTSIRNNENNTMRLQQEHLFNQQQHQQQQRSSLENEFDLNAMFSGSGSSTFNPTSSESSVLPRSHTTSSISSSPFESASFWGTTTEDKNTTESPSAIGDIASHPVTSTGSSSFSTQSSHFQNHSHQQHQHWGYGGESHFSGQSGREVMFGSGSMDSGVVGSGFSQQGGSSGSPFDSLWSEASATNGATTSNHNHQQQQHNNNDTFSDIFGGSWGTSNDAHQQDDRMNLRHSLELQPDHRNSHHNHHHQSPVETAFESFRSEVTPTQQPTAEPSPFSSNSSNIGDWLMKVARASGNVAAQGQLLHEMINSRSWEAFCIALPRLSLGAREWKNGIDGNSNALMAACRQQCPVRVVNSLLKDMPLSYREETNRDGNTCLIIASAFGTSLDVIQALITGMSSSFVSFKNESGTDALHWATQQMSNPEVIGFLKGAAARV